MNTARIQIGVRLERKLWPLPIDPQAVAAFCRDAGVDFVDIDIDVIEDVLGRPSPIVPFDPPPIDGVSLGLLELEEEVLADSYHLAKASFDDQLRVWRAGASLARLAAWRGAFADARVAIRAVQVPWTRTPEASVADLAARAAVALGSAAADTSAAVVVDAAPESVGDDPREALRQAVLACRAGLGR